jgi:hypothetical protein
MNRDIAKLENKGYVTVEEVTPEPRNGQILVPVRRQGAAALSLALQ